MPLLSRFPSFLLLFESLLKSKVCLHSFVFHFPSSWKEQENKIGRSLKPFKKNNLISTTFQNIELQNRQRIDVSFLNCHVILSEIGGSDETSKYLEGLFKKRREMKGSDIWLIQGTLEYFNNISLYLNDNVFLIQETPSKKNLIQNTKYGSQGYDIFELYGFKGHSFKKIALLETWTGAELDLSVIWTQKLVRRRNLTNVVLRVSTQIELDLVRANDVSPSGTRMSGQIPDVFHMIQSIFNFTYDYKENIDALGGYYNEETGRWNGLVRMLLDDEIDFAVCGMTFSNKRNKVVSYLPTLVTTSCRFFMSYSLAHQNAYLSIFKGSQWIYILLTLLSASVLLLHLMTYNSSSWKSRVHETFKIPKRLSNIHQESFTIQLGFFSILLSVMVLNYHWCALLISYLSKTYPSIPFSNLNELLENPNLHVITHNSSNYLKEFMTSDQNEKNISSNLLNRLYTQKLKVNYKNNYTISELLNLIINNSSILLYQDFNYIRDSYEYRTCQIIEVPHDKLEIPASVTLQKNSSYYELFSYTYLVLFENGIKSQIFKRNQSESVSCQFEEGNPLGLKSTSGSFMILILGMILSIFVLLAEFLFSFGLVFVF